MNQSVSQELEGGETPVSTLAFDFLALEEVMRGVAVGEASEAREKALDELMTLLTCFSFLMRSSCCWFSSSFLIFW